MAQVQISSELEPRHKANTWRGFFIKKRLIQLFSVIAFFAVWQWLASAGYFPRYVLPAPSAIFNALIKEWNTGRLFSLVGLSLNHYLPGVAAGIGVGVVVGILTGWSSRLETFLEPILRLLRPIPPLAWIPFAIVWFGISQTAAVFIIFVVAFWINYYNSYMGVKDVDKKLLDAARSLGVRAPLKLVFKVVLPHATPAILTGMRTSIGQGWMAIVAAELFGIRGVGLHMQEAAGYLAMHVVMAYMLVLGILFSFSDSLFRSLEHWLLRWRA